jgi:hypothetical protein
MPARRLRMSCEFSEMQVVRWCGEDARILEVRGDRVALLRLRDDQTILTTLDVLRDEQPLEGYGPRSLLGPVA